MIEDGYDCVCIKCNRKMYNYGKKEAMQPSGGLVFETYGHYGSAFFDPMDGSKIEICVCDPCLREFFGKEYHE